MNNWSIAGIVVGFLISLLSAIRYFVIWVDYSQAIAFISIGVFVMAIAWIYQVLRHNEARIEAIEEYLEDKK